MHAQMVENLDMGVLVPNWATKVSRVNNADAEIDKNGSK